ncbi:phosphotriesterase family protein [Catellicoccus marimammalium]|uniref:Aryldialkylphosphatase n=1 Tax=Catellicoccus marimammalium M35/04/3 TaxID=1234409 RepID=K8ZNQ8_9ENTE|nr:amidohydrolase family protein [Catellicoccus marimammalium]EKU27231.1 Aryldialkylphosphatase [Catellicoccus marimammalium M35/04/3]
MKIHTVNGDIDSTELGITLMHEHITYADWVMRANFGYHFCEPDLIVEAAVEQFSKLKKYGVKTVVDASVPNIGRDVHLIKEVSERTGLNFIVSSGFYYQQEPALEYRPEDQIYELLLEECTNGVVDSNIIPGIMKAATGPEGVTPYTEKLHRAIGRVATKLNLPIFSHHHPDTKCGNKILDILEDVGVPANKIIIGHTGDTNDLDYIESLLKRGCYIGMDRFGYCDMGNDLEHRVQTIATLCDKGYADQMFLSHDLAVFIGVYDYWPEFAKNELFNPKIDYTFLFEQALPKMKALGVSDQQILQMLEQNPKNIFEA